MAFVLKLYKPVCYHRVFGVAGILQTLLFLPPASDCGEVRGWPCPLWLFCIIQDSRTKEVFLKSPINALILELLSNLEVLIWIIS